MHLGLVADIICSVIYMTEISLNVTLSNQSHEHFHAYDERRNPIDFGSSVRKFGSIVAQIALCLFHFSKLKFCYSKKHLIEDLTSI